MLETDKVERRRRFSRLESGPGKQQFKEVILSRQHGSPNVSSSQESSRLALPSIVIVPAFGCFRMRVAVSLRGVTSSIDEILFKLCVVA